VKPLADNIVVERIEEDGIIKVQHDQYIVVKIKTLPPYIVTDGGIYDHVQEVTNPLFDHIEEGDEVLVTYIREFRVKGEKVYVVKVADIIGVV
jgi:co-chaperonin GroES (HSP10)